MLGGGLLSIAVLPCIYFDAGYSLVAIGWAICVAMAAFSRFDLPRPQMMEEEEPPVMQLAELPRISASEKIQNLERLAKLKASGVISSEEFNSEKKNFLG